MRIHAIHIEHLLSFETFSWDNLDPHLNVIVGPNGVGKTNLFHALRAICDALSIERRQVTTLWANAGHHGTNADTITIEVELELTTAWEQEVLGTFFAAVLCDQQEIQHRINETTHRSLDPTGLRQFAVWVHERLCVDDLAWLFRGRLIATYGPRIAQRAYILDITFAHARIDYSEATRLVESAGVIDREEVQPGRRIECVTGIQQRTSDASATPSRVYRHLGDKHGDRPIGESPHKANDGFPFYSH